MMKIPVFLLVATILTTPIFGTNRQARIIGGRPIDSHDWSWMAALVYKDRPNVEGLFCGGSLIHKEWILTAAHCVYGLKNFHFDILINEDILGSGSGEKKSVEEIIIHPFYDDIFLDNDLALIKLGSASKETPVKILAPHSIQDIPTKISLALGWGTTSPNYDTLSLSLNEVDLPIIDNQLCDEVMGDVTAEMLCAGDGLGERDTCFGDSGGPLVVFDTESKTWRQAGITSWGFGCAEPGYYGVYTRLQKYASFISDNICSSEEIPLPPMMQLQIKHHQATVDWKQISNPYSSNSGYRLNYAPYPLAENIYSIDMNQSDNFSVKLPTGSAYYVAISSYNGNCLSNYSNIEAFTIE